VGVDKQLFGSDSKRLAIQDQVFELCTSEEVQTVLLIVPAMVLIKDIPTWIALQWDLFPLLCQCPQCPNNDPLQSGGRSLTSPQDV